MNVERPEGFEQWHHRSLVLLAGSPDGLHVVVDAVTAPTISRTDADYLVQHCLAFVDGDDARTVRISEKGRDLVAALHEEAHA